MEGVVIIQLSLFWRGVQSMLTNIYITVCLRSYRPDVSAARRGVFVNSCCTATT